MPCRSGFQRSVIKKTRKIILEDLCTITAQKCGSRKFKSYIKFKKLNCPTFFFNVSSLNFLHLSTLDLDIYLKVHRAMITVLYFRKDLHIFDLIFKILCHIDIIDPPAFILKPCCWPQNIPPCILVRLFI